MVWFAKRLFASLMVLLLLSFMVLPPPCSPLSSPNIAISIDSPPASTYNSTFRCNSGSNCIFTCTHSLAACLKSTFVCEPNSTCTLECEQSLACSKGLVQCHPGAECIVHCTGPGACYALKCDGQNCQQNETFTFASLFGITIRLTVIEAFVRHGYDVRNVFAVTEGALQILSPDLPPLYDRNEFLKMQGKIWKEVVSIINEMNSTMWLCFPNYTIARIHREVLMINGDIHFVNDVLKLGMEDLLSRTPWGKYIQLSDLQYIVTSQKASYQFNYHPNNQYNITDIIIMLSKIMEDYGYDLLGLNRNSSFISVEMYALNSTMIVAYVQVILSHNCSLPAPFYGSYCLFGRWYSKGTLTVSLDDLIASPSNAHHNGSMMVYTVPFVVDRSSFSTEGNFSVSHNATLSVSKSSSVLVGGNFSLQSSTLVLSDNASLVISSSFTSNNSSLVLELSESNRQSIALGDTVNVQVATYTKFNGGFDNISLANLNSNQSSSDCPISVTPYYEDKRCIISISLSDCSAPVSSNWKLILTLVLVCTMIPLIGLSAVFVYLKNKALRGKLTNFQKKESGP